MLLVKDQEQADLARRFCSLGYGSTSATKQKFTKQARLRDRHLELN